jgi:hypothetical protein
LEKNHVDKNAHSQIRTSQITLGLASTSLVITLVMSGFYIADTTTGDSHLRNVLATLGFCEALDPGLPAQPATDTGATNSQTNLGDQDSVGVPGQDGSSGTDGTDGIDGAPGDLGSTGVTGDRGEPGPTGPAGLAGPAGPCTYILDLALIDGNLVPSADNTYSLGSSKFRWKDLQLGPGTLFIEDPGTGEQVSITVKDGSLLLDGADSLRIGNVRLTATGIESLLADQDITIGNLGDTGYVVLARGLKFPDGTVQSTASSGGPVGPAGPAGPIGPQGEPSALIGYSEQVACVENKDGLMIGQIQLGSCLDNKSNGTNISILMKLP